MYNEQSLSYPILCLCTNDGPYWHLARQVEELVVCSQRALKSGFYSSLRVIDSSGNRYAVLKAVKAATVGPLRRFRLFGSPQIRVALQLEKTPYEPLADVKSELLRFVDTVEMYDGATQVRRVIRNATDFSDMISILADNFYREY